MADGGCRENSDRRWRDGIAQGRPAECYRIDGEWERMKREALEEAEDFVGYALQREKGDRIRDLPSWRPRWAVRLVRIAHWLMRADGG